MNSSKHSQQTIERMKANSEAAKRRLARLNDEYLLRQKVRKLSSSREKATRETFGEAVARIAKEHYLAI
jgi:hypothetical protein